MGLVPAHTAQRPLTAIAKWLSPLENGEQHEERSTELDQAAFDSLLPTAQMNRRGFVTTLAAAGFALAVQPVQASTVITTDASGLDAGSATVKASGSELPVYYARPAQGDKLPVVLVVQEIFGVHEHIRDVCRRLAKQGYLAIAPELFFRQGDPTKLENVADILSSIVSKVPDAQVMADLDACAEWAVTRGGDAARLAITGFCWVDASPGCMLRTTRSSRRVSPGMAGSTAPPRTTSRSSRSTSPQT